MVIIEMVVLFVKYWSSRSEELTVNCGDSKYTDVACYKLRLINENRQSATRWFIARRITFDQIITG